MFPSTPACPNPVQLPFGHGCECTLSAGCGVYPIEPRPPILGEALVVTTGRNEGFFKHTFASIGTSPADETSTHNATMKIIIDPTIQYQAILGFGAAITDASSLMLTELLDTTLMTEVLQQAFDFADFSFARVPMNAADFSRMDYSLAHELDLSDFCLRDDRTPDGDPVTCGQDYKLDVLEQIVAIQPDLKLYVSSWSAPPSFKTQHFTCEQYSGAIECTPNPDAPAQVECFRTVADPTTCIGQPLNTPCDATPPNNYSSGFPLVPGLDPNYNPNNIPSKNADDNCYNAGFIRDEAYQSWAGMYAKFIQAYAERGVKMWGITSQNEPFTQTGLWNSNFWTVETLSTFVNDFLGPAVREVQPDIQIMVYDDQLINLTDAAMEMALSTQAVSNGIAFHWYNTLESVFENTTAAPPIPGFGFPLVGGGLDVKTLYDAFNGTKFLLMSESCSGYLLGSDFLGPRHGSFAFGYNTAHDMLWDLKNRAGGYVYWNLILDSLGGPNHAGNYVDSPMYVENATAFVMNPSFFYISHFSRFVPSGSVAIEADVDCGASKFEYCQFVAFRTPNNDVVVVMTNDEVTTDIVSPLPLPPLAKGEGAPIEWTINCGDSVLTGVLPWQAIQTIVLPCVADTPAPTLFPVPAPTPSPVVVETEAPNAISSPVPPSKTDSPSDSASKKSKKGGMKMMMGSRSVGVPLGSLGY